jgi:predicted HNH restriction endonuclease
VPRGRPDEGKNSQGPHYQRDRARANRQFLNEYLIAHPCNICGFSDIRALQFHHRNPREKLFSVSQYGTRGREALQKEIAKCEVVCANCHSILHNKDKMEAIERHRARKRKEALDAL